MGGVYLFTLSNIPVSISGWYFALIGYYAYSSGMARGLLFGLCVTVSLLVHEFGHALVAKHYKLSPSVLLHGLGGLCFHERATRDKHDAFIVAAGPFAGLVFGGLTYIVYKVIWAYRPDLIHDSEPFQLTFVFLLYINIVWSLANLLPLWPLDGGQLFRLLMQKLLPPDKAAYATHIVGIVVGLSAIAFTLLYIRSPFIIIIAGMLTYQNFTQLSSIPGGRSQSRFSKGLLVDAENALKAGDATEAARLCHQLQSDASTPSAAQDKAWAILAVSSYALGEQDAADSYAERAPDKLVLAMLDLLPKQEPPKQPPSDA